MRKRIGMTMRMSGVTTAMAIILDRTRKTIISTSLRSHGIPSSAVSMSLENLERERWKDDK